MLLVQVAVVILLLVPAASASLVLLLLLLFLLLHHLLHLLLLLHLLHQRMIVIVGSAKTSAKTSAMTSGVSASARAAKEKLQQPFAPFPARGQRKIESPLIRSGAGGVQIPGSSTALPAGVQDVRNAALNAAAAQAKRGQKLIEKQAFEQRTMSNR